MNTTYSSGWIALVVLMSIFLCLIFSACSGIVMYYRRRRDERRFAGEELKGLAKPWLVVSATAALGSHRPLRIGDGARSLESARCNGTVTVLVCTAQPRSCDHRMSPHTRGLLPSADSMHLVHTRSRDQALLVNAAGDHGKSVRRPQTAPRAAEGIGSLWHVASSCPY